MIKIGIIGTGKMGEYHCRILSEWRNQRKNEIQFIGLHDIDHDSGQKLARQYQTFFFDNSLELLKEVDALVVAASTSAHFQIAKLVLENKKHLLIEKPLTENLTEAKELFQIAQKNNLVLQVGHVERYNPVVLSLKKHFTIPLLWESRRMLLPENRPINSAVCTDLLTHDLDLFFQFCGRHLKNISEIQIAASGEKVSSDFKDIAIAQIKIPQPRLESTFDKGYFQESKYILANFIASRIHHKPERTLILSQPENTVVLDFNAKSFEILTGERSHNIAIKKQNALELEIKDFIHHIKNDVQYTVKNEPLDLLVLETLLEIKTQINYH